MHQKGSPILFVQAIWELAEQISAPAPPDLFFSPKQRLGRVAMRGGFLAMLFHARNFCFELADPLVQFFLGIGVEILRREPARCIADSGCRAARTIIFFH